MTSRDARGGTRRRLAAVGAMSALTITLPVLLGLRIAAAESVTFSSGTQDPIVVTTIPGDAGTLPDPVDQGTGEEPVTIEDALTPRPDDLTQSRITWLRGDGLGMPVSNGGTIDLGDGFAVMVTLSPYPPVNFDPATVDYVLTRHGEPVTGAAITVAYDMRFMYHGPFVVDPVIGADGAFASTHSFFMFGPWQIDVTATPPDHEPLAFSISIYVWPTS